MEYTKILKEQKVRIKEIIFEHSLLDRDEVDKLSNRKLIEILINFHN